MPWDARVGAVGLRAVALSVVGATAAPVQLLGGPSPSTGLLRVFYDTSWGTVCNSTFGHAEAVVTCRELGYATGAVVVALNSSVGASTPVLLDNVTCTGAGAAPGYAAGDRPAAVPLAVVAGGRG